MKKRAAFLLVISSVGILLTGCTVRGGVRKGKDLLKKVWNKGISILDKFFANDKPTKTASGIEYTISYHK